MAKTKGSADSKRHVVTMRMSDTARSKIVEAAQSNGRSVSQEIESRLERSFQEESLLGGSDTSLVSRLVSGAVGLVELETGKPWTEDRMTWEAVHAATEAILDWFQPSIDDDIWHGDTKPFAALLDAATEADEIERRLEGLRQAFSYVASDHKSVPTAIRDEYKKALAARPAAQKQLSVAARRCLEGPMKEHENRAKEARQMGREMVAPRAKKLRNNIDVGNAMRLFVRDGKVEPLQSTREPSEAVSEKALWRFIRTLAAINEGENDASNPQA